MKTPAKPQTPTTPAKDTGSLAASVLGGRLSKEAAIDRLVEQRLQGRFPRKLT